jgi:hypothetical protein
MRNVYSIFIGKPDRKRPLGRPRCRCENNIRIVVREIEWEGLDWMHLDQGTDHWLTLVNKVMNFQVP